MTAKVDYALAYTAASRPAPKAADDAFYLDDQPLRFARDPRKVAKTDFTGDRVWEPLRGTRLGYHLAEISRTFGSRDPHLKRLAEAALSGSTAGSRGGRDVFSAIRDRLQMHAKMEVAPVPNTGATTGVTDSERAYRKRAAELAGAYNWNRVADSLQVDELVGDYVRSIAKDHIKGRELREAAKRFSSGSGLEGARFGGSRDAHSVALADTGSSVGRFWEGLRSHIGSRMTDTFGGRSSSVTDEMLDRSLRRLAINEEQSSDVTSTKADAYKPRPNPAGGTDYHWRDYLKWTPASKGRSGVEHYRRKLREVMEKVDPFEIAFREKPVRYSRYSHADFHDILQRHPNETTPALIYSDWLQQRGQWAHAEVIRNHLQRLGYGTHTEPITTLPDDFVGEYHNSDLQPGQSVVTVNPQPTEKGQHAVTVGMRSEADHSNMLYWSGMFDSESTSDILRGLREEGARLKLTPEERRQHKVDGSDVELYSRDEISRYEAYRAPAGGIVVRGLFYPGGTLIPDLEEHTDSQPQPQEPAPVQFDRSTPGWTRLRKLLSRKPRVRRSLNTTGG